MNTQKQNKKPVNVKNVPASAPKKKKPRPKSKGKQAIPHTVITDPRLLVSAQGVLPVISVPVVVNEESLWAWPLGLLSLAMVRGVKVDSYAVYSEMFLDLCAVMTSSPSPVNVRLSYLNDILASFQPKTVPFRLTTKLTYSYNAFSTDLPGPIFTLRGYNYYMYNIASDSTDFGVQTAPPSFDAQERLAIYGDAMGLLAGTKKHNALIKKVDFGSTTDKSPGSAYINDSSAFARNSPYYGDAAGVGSPYGSLESEVPFKSPLLGVLTQYDPGQPRASRRLRVTSGDSCSNLAIGALDKFPTPFYDGAVPPIYKFLDINEVAFSLGVSVANALTKMYTVPNPDSNVFQTTGFPWTYQQFLLALRQQVLAMFCDSQCIGQFMAPDKTGSNLWEPLRCGSNCYPAPPKIPMRIPKFLNENLRMLKMIVRPYETKKFKSDKNHITHIPVWGAFQAYDTDPNITFTNAEGEQQRVFASTNPGPNPNIWDGKEGGTVYDLNFSDILTQVVLSWNDLMGAITPALSGVDTIGGDGQLSPLLQYTRYVKFESGGNPHEIKPWMIPRISNHVKAYIKEVEEMVEPIVKDSKDAKRMSKKEVRRYSVYAPPFSSPYGEYERGVSCILPITPTAKTYLRELILPIIEVEVGDGVPNFSQVQVANLEPYSYKNEEINPYQSRAFCMITSAVNNVVGVAAKETPFAQFVDELSKQNLGGFFGDLFSAVGAVGSSLGFNGLGGVASTLGNVANSLNI